jgi:hypothetical protein
MMVMDPLKPPDDTLDMAFDNTRATFPIHPNVLLSISPTSTESSPLPVMYQKKESSVELDPVCGMNSMKSQTQVMRAIEFLWGFEVITM